MKINKRKILIAILIALVICICALVITYTAYAKTIGQYEEQIAENRVEIKNLDEVKAQLHTTAEILRANNFINQGFDALLSQKWFECDAYQEQKINENIELQAEVDKLREEQSKKTLIGNFKITHYCPCSICNGSWGNKTALGTTLTPYRTIAVDPKVIPLGSKVEINGKVYIAEDTGGAIKGYRIDMCVASHSEAYQKGVLTNVPVYIVP